MPAPKVADVEEFMERLDDVQRPHLTKLREISLEAAKGTGVEEALKYNFPAYVSPTMVWTLQCFKHHCAVRFPTQFFADFKGEVEAAGYEAIEGSIKIKWDEQVPAALITKLIKARIADYQSGNTAWSAPGQYAGKKK
jgi:uncharacterized protein YdhG (YjbR/CyaY superfamily)